MSDFDHDKLDAKDLALLGLLNESQRSPESGPDLILCAR